MESTWTISELAELAGAALADEPVRVNGRVRETPNERLIRWYTTIGLVDPPSGRRGRTALYGPRHLLQLVAVKRRQAAGRAIAEIQAELTGATDATLRDIARLPETVVGGPGEPSAVRRPAARARFWAESAPSFGPRPAAPQQVASLQAAPEHVAPPPAAPPAVASPVPGASLPAGDNAVQPAAGPAVVPGLRLAAGVTLLLDAAARGLTAEDLAAIEAAARPLLDELRRRGLHPDAPDHPAPPENPDRSEPAPPASPGR